MNGPHLESILALATSDSGKLLALGGKRDAPDLKTSEVHIVEFPKWKPRHAIALPSAATALCFAGDALLIGSQDGALLEVDVSSATPKTQEIASLTGSITKIQTLLDSAGKLVGAVSVGEDGALQVFSLPKGKLKATHPLDVGPLGALAVSPDGRFVAAAGDAGVIQVLKRDKLELGAPRSVTCGEGSITSLVFTDDGRLIVGGADGSIRLCFAEGASDEEDRSQSHSHDGAVKDLCLLPEVQDKAGRPQARRFFSIGSDGNLRSWLLEGRRKPRTIELGKKVLRALVWAPSRSRDEDKKGGTLVFANQRREIHLVELSGEADMGEPELVGSEFTRLGEALNAKSADVRSATLRVLAALPEDRARSLMERTLKKEKRSDVRTVAAQLLGQSGRRRSRPVLAAALNDVHADVRREAFAALVALEPESSLRPLELALRQGKAEQRRQAIAALVPLSPSSPTVPTLVTGCLHDDDAKVRVAAMDGLLAIHAQDDSSTDAEGQTLVLQACLQHGTTDVQVEALFRFGRAFLGATEDGQPVLERTLDHATEEVRKAAFLVLVGSIPSLVGGLIQADRQFGAMLARVQEHGNFVNEPVLLGSVPDEAARAPLFSALCSSHPDIALLAARCVAQLGDDRAAGVLLQLSQERDAAFRRSVVEEIKRASESLVADQRLRDRLTQFMGDADVEIRSLAFKLGAEAAHVAGPEAELAHSEEALRSAFADMRLRALSVLVNFGGKGDHKEFSERASALLYQALDDEDEKVHNEAFRTLWSWGEPQNTLERGAKVRQLGVRLRVVSELAKQKRTDWVETLLEQLILDVALDVALAAYQAATSTKQGKKAHRYHLTALSSVLSELKIAAAKQVAELHIGNDEITKCLREMVASEVGEEQLAGIEAIDVLSPDDGAFTTAFASAFYVVRVRAGELCGKRRDLRASETLEKFLTIPKADLNRPADEMRARAAAALADLGDPRRLTFYGSLLDDEDGHVREMGARGLSMASPPGKSEALVDALSHADLAVRSWAAEGLARHGDSRALPVLTGTLMHGHRPLRIGAVLGAASLGASGTHGLLQALQDEDRRIRELALAIIVARDHALAEAKEAPDLLLSVLSVPSAELRFIAARCLEQRSSDAGLSDLVRGLVGPPIPDKVSETKEWPKPTDRDALFNVVMRALASDDPTQRCASARVLALRHQPLAYFREAKLLSGPVSAHRPWIPSAGFESEASIEPNKQGWLRSLIARSTSSGSRSATERVLQIIERDANAQQAPSEAATTLTADQTERLLFGVYAGLIRQAPVSGESDETHRLRRESMQRLAPLAGLESVGQAAVLAVARRGLSDPHHRVRKAAVDLLTQLCGATSLTPLEAALASGSSDVGRAAVDEILARILGGGEVGPERALLVAALAAPEKSVRHHALSLLPQVFEKDSLEPWLLALESEFSDVRFAVVERLSEVQDSRVEGALVRALSSDHEELRRRAATALAKRGDARALGVLAQWLSLEDKLAQSQAMRSLVALAYACRKKDKPQVADEVTQVLISRATDDPDKTAQRELLISTIERIASRTAISFLLEQVLHGKAALQSKCFGALLKIAKLKDVPPVRVVGGRLRERYDEQLALSILEQVAVSSSHEIRSEVVEALCDVDAAQADVLLERFLQDRETTVRVSAAEALAFRAQVLPESRARSVLESCLKAGRRELILPSAEGLAQAKKPEAFQPLMLVYKAGESEEQKRAVRALGDLADERAMKELEALVQPSAELEEFEVPLVPAAVEALGAMAPRLPEHRDRLVELLLRLLDEGPSAVQLGVVIGFRRGGGETGRLLLEKLAADTTRETAIRQSSLEQLETLASPASAPGLAELLLDPNWRLAHQALSALKKSLPEAPTQVALYCLRSPHSALVETAAQHLAEQGDAGELVSSFDQLKEPAVRRTMSRGLIRRKLFPVPELRAALIGASDSARVEAALMVGASGQAGEFDVQLKKAAKEVAPRLSELQRDATEATEASEALSAVLWAALRLDVKVVEVSRTVLEGAKKTDGLTTLCLQVLSAQGSDKDLPLASSFLGHTSLQVRQAAGAACAAFSAKSPVAHLKKLTHSQSASREVLKNALEKSSLEAELLSDKGLRTLTLPAVLGRQQPGELLSLAKKGDEAARLSAIYALGRQGGAEASEVLKALVADQGETERIRQAAFKALRRLQRKAERAARYEAS